MSGSATWTELYRARTIAHIDGKTVIGPWVEYGPTAVDGVRHAIDASTERLFRNLRSTASLEGQAEKRSDDGRWPSDD